MNFLRSRLVVAFLAAALAAAITLVISHRLQRKSTAGATFGSRTELTETENKAYTDATGTTPGQVAKDFFDALANDDWTAATKFFPPGFLEKDASLMERFKSAYGGVQVISIGKPFKATLAKSGNRSYPGAYVPYEIRLKNGEVKRWQLAVRCDNPDKRWYWDGGL
jgi:hypothetical protein